MVGPSTAHVFFEGPVEGDADDDDGDGFDEVDTQLVELDLVGNSSVGTLHMHLNPGIPSVGGMTERTNATPGTPGRASLHGERPGGQLLRGLLRDRAARRHGAPQRGAEAAELANLPQAAGGAGGLRGPSTRSSSTTPTGTRRST